jgi:hypothetical protein
VKSFGFAGIIGDPPLLFGPKSSALRTDDLFG